MSVPEGPRTRNAAGSSGSTPSTLSGELRRTDNEDDQDWSTSAESCRIAAFLPSFLAELSEDEAEEFQENYRKYLRPKRPGEHEKCLASIQEANAKRGRATRGSGKGKTKKIVHEIQFYDQKHRKVVPLTLTPSEVDDDLLAILGATPGAFDAKPSTQNVQTRRGAKRSNNSVDHSATGSDSEQELEQPRPKRARSTSAANNNGAPTNTHTANDRKEKDDAAGGGGGVVGKMFVKHADKKGWVVCQRCHTSVWPPNCSKHRQACAM